MNSFPLEMHKEMGMQEPEFDLQSILLRGKCTFTTSTKIPLYVFLVRRILCRSAQALKMHHNICAHGLSTYATEVCYKMF